MIGDPDPNSALEGSLSIKPSWQLPGGSFAQQGKFWAEQNELNSSSSSPAVDYSGAGPLFVFLLLLPVFYPPGYLIYTTWVIGSEAQWLPGLQFLIMGLQVVSLCGGIWLIIRVMPWPILALLNAVYFGSCYAEASFLLNAPLIVTVTVIPCAAGVGFWIGRQLSFMVRLIRHQLPKPLRLFCGLVFLAGFTVTSFTRLDALERSQLRPGYLVDVNSSITLWDKNNQVFGIDSGRKLCFVSMSTAYGRTIATVKLSGISPYDDSTVYTTLTPNALVGDPTGTPCGS